MTWNVAIYRDHRGEEPVAEYVEQLLRAGDRSAVATLERYIDLLQDNGPGLGMPQDRLLDSKIRLYELRAGDHRVAYGEAGGMLYLLEAWRKTSRRAPEQSVARARRRLLQLRG